MKAPFPCPRPSSTASWSSCRSAIPTPEEEDEILRRRAERKQDAVSLQAVITPEIFLAMRAAVEEVYVDPDVRRYMVDLVTQTRRHRQVVVGASPRGSLALLKLARAWAAMAGRRLCHAGRRQAVRPTRPGPPHHPGSQPVGCEDDGRNRDRRSRPGGHRCRCSRPSQ